MTRYERTKARVAATCAAWNAQYPVGTPVRYWTGLREGPGVLSVTRSTAQPRSTHASVWVNGEASSINLTHVEPDMAFDPARVRWELRLGQHTGSAWAHGLQFHCQIHTRYGATGDTNPANPDWKWWATCSLWGAGAGPLHGGQCTTAAFGANSWQACRAAMERQAREWFAAGKERVE